MRRVRQAAAVLALAAVVALAGCSTGLDSDRPTPTSASPHPTPPPPTPASTPTPSASAAQSAVVPGEYVGIYPAQIPVDLGARDYATGTVDLDANGVPAAYHVASGDVIDDIAARFGLSSHLADHLDFDYLNAINQVRRGGYPWRLYAGDTLNLSPYTVTSVGDIDGVVRHDPPPALLPPQH